MSIRETINQKPQIVTVAVLLLVAGLSIAMFLQFHDKTESITGAKRYYSVDNGQTWFADSALALSPFMKDGKEAVAAHVCSQNGKQFVAYLERYTPEAIAAINDFRAEAAKPNNKVGMGPWSWVATRGREIKRPADKEWTNCKDEMAATAIQRPIGPNGSAANVVDVDP